MSAFASRWHDCFAGLADAAGQLVHGESHATRARARQAAGLSTCRAVASAAPCRRARPDARRAARRREDRGAGRAGHRLRLARRACSASREGAGLAELALLAILTFASAATIAGAGGLSSPFALLALAPLAEGDLGAARPPRPHRRLGRFRGRACRLQAIIALALDIGAARRDGLALAGSRRLRSRRWSRAPRPSSASASAQAAARRPVAAEDVIDAAVLRLARSGEVLDVGGKAEPLLGLQPALLLGSGLFERVHVGDRVGYLCALSELRDGAPLRKLEVRLRAPRTASERGGLSPFLRSSSPVPATPSGR